MEEPNSLVGGYLMGDVLAARSLPFAVKLWLSALRREERGVAVAGRRGEDMLVWLLVLLFLSTFL